MSRRLVDTHEAWLLDWPLRLAALALLWRLCAWLFLWGGMRSPWPPAVLLDARAVLLLVACALLLLLRCLVPREFAAASAMPLSALLLWLAVEQLPRFGLLLDWPLGLLSPGQYAGAATLVTSSLLLPLVLQLRWSGQLRGHGIEWTRRWAQRHSYSARLLARRALHYMGADSDDED